MHLLLISILTKVTETVCGKKCLLLVLYENSGEDSNESMNQTPKKT